MTIIYIIYVTKKGYKSKSSINLCIVERMKFDIHPSNPSLFFPLNPIKRT